MNNKLSENIKSILEGLSTIVFILYLIYFNDINIYTILEKINLNTSICFTLILIILIIGTVYIFKVSRVIGGYLFILITLTIKTQYNYIELFNTNTTPTPTATKYTTSDINKIIKYLTKQIDNDPNKTELDKKVMKDITEQYFVNTNKIQELLKFNKNAMVKNPVEDE